MLLQELLDVILPKAHDPSDQMAREFARLDHSIDGHFVELEEVSELSHRVELSRSYLPGLSALFGFGIVAVSHVLLPRAI
jgi:hypothetical protein